MQFPIVRLQAPTLAQLYFSPVCGLSPNWEILEAQPLMQKALSSKGALFYLHLFIYVGKVMNRVFIGQFLIRFIQNLKLQLEILFF